MTENIEKDIFTIYGKIKDKNAVIVAIARECKNATHTVYNWFHQYKLIAKKNWPAAIDAIVAQYKIEQNENNEIIKRLKKYENETIPKV